MRKLKRVLKPMAALSMAVLFAGGCGLFKGGEEGVDPRSYESIQDALVNMQSYQSEASVKYISNKGENEYLTLQQCRSTGEYRVEVTGPAEVAGNVTLSDGATICQYNQRVEGKIAVGTTETQERSEIFLTSFVKNYLSSQEVSVSVANMEEGKATVLEANISGAHPYLATEKLWMDNETYQPIQLVIYDPDGSERIVVTYNSFEYDTQFDDTLFQVPQA